MALGRKTDLTLVRPLGSGDHKAFIRKGTLGAATEAGEIVAMQSDGKYDPAAASGVILFAGVAVQSGGDGDAVDIVMYGPMEVLTGATPGTGLDAASSAVLGAAADTLAGALAGRTLAALAPCPHWATVTRPDPPGENSSTSNRWKLKLWRNSWAIAAMPSSRRQCRADRRQRFSKL